MIVYSVIFFGLLLAYVIYSQWNSEILNTSEGKFEEAAIDYLFLTHLVPIILIPTAWYEARKVADCFNLWTEFEVIKTQHPRVLSRILQSARRHGERVEIRVFPPSAHMRVLHPAPGREIDASAPNSRALIRLHPLPLIMELVRDNWYLCVSRDGAKVF